MALVSPSDQQRLREAFAEMTRPVRLLFFTQTLGCETCPQTRRILDELPPLSDKITIEEVNLILDADKARMYGIDRAPAIAITYEANPVGVERSAVSPGLQGSEDLRENDETSAIPVDPLSSWIDSRMRFLGTPAGYEFISLVQAVLIAGGQPLRLSEESHKRLASVSRPVTMQVFTTPT